MHPWAEGRVSILAVEAVGMAVMEEVGDTQAKDIHTGRLHVPLVLFTTRGPAGQRQGLLRVTPAAADPPVTLELAEV